MNDDADTLAAVLDSMQDGLRTWLVGGIARPSDRPESWAFVGAPVLTILAHLRLARAAVTARSPTFLECGSGLGVIAALARHVGFRVTGIEVVPRYVELSRCFFPQVPIEEADLLTFDRFGEYDVVYYYAPFADKDVGAAFERRVEASLRPGAVLLANGKVTDDWRQSRELEELASDGPSWRVLRKRGPVPAR